LAVVFLAVAIVLSLGIWWWKSRSADVPSVAKALTEAGAANQTGGETRPDFQRLKGRWQRPDGGYVVEIKNIADSGAMDTAYFNPNPIHVAKAEASRDADGTKVFIELRDVNYPGSTYTLTYDPASDQLKGIYYQAVEQQRFPVIFLRLQ
jgi:uncharacterized protein (DUF2147 family)